ncbi:MAG: NusG domain II-containing protein [Lachnospiraceae bacterium]|nr:NusG domain II-containing protein [Lachnospiraceae bacterium]
MRRRDVLFGVGVLLIVIGCFLLRGLVFQGDAAYVEFSQDGRMIRRVRLSDMEGQDIRIDAAEGGYNLIHVENGSVFVREADCENGDCIRQGTIRHMGESIICLPHKLAITIVGDTDGTGGDGRDEEQYDTIIR